MTPTKPKAVGYIRVSTAEQVEGESLDTQRNQIKQFAEIKGGGGMGGVVAKGRPVHGESV